MNPDTTNSAPSRESASECEGTVLQGSGHGSSGAHNSDREEELRKLYRTLKALSRSSQAMMRASDESSYMHEVCTIVQEDCGHAMVWIGFAMDDEEKTVQPAMHAGFDEGYLETLRLTWADTERGRGPTGVAIRTGKPCMCGNMLTDPQFKPWREEALRRGYAASIALPLSVNQRTFGALTIYSREPDPFSSDEIQLLSELANDLAYGITAIRLRAAHTEAEAALMRSEERYRSLFEQMTEGFALHEIICDQNGVPCDYRFLEINPAFERLTGLTRQAVIGKLKTHVLPDDDPAWIEKYGHVALTRQPVRFSNYSPALKRYYEVFAYSPAPRQFAVLFMDVTERIVAEERLRKSEEGFRVMVTHSAEPMLLVDEYATIECVSGVAADLLGYSETEMMGLNVERFIDWNSKLDMAMHLRDFRQFAPQPAKATLRLKRRDGTYCWADVTASFANYGQKPEKYLVKVEIIDLDKTGAQFTVHSS